LIEDSYAQFEKDKVIEACAFGLKWYQFQRDTYYDQLITEELERRNKQKKPWWKFWGKPPRNNWTRSELSAEYEKDLLDGDNYWWNPLVSAKHLHKEDEKDILRLKKLAESTTSGTVYLSGSDNKRLYKFYKAE
jgi:hypothetical protein